MASRTGRASAADRGYGHKWRKYRKRFLRAHPVCVYCLKVGRTAVATVVDHIVPHKGDKALFWDPANHQALCKACHDGAKKEQERTGTLRGCAADGTPLDPQHHWNRGERGAEGRARGGRGKPTGVGG